MNVLVVDIGGTSVKVLATGHDERRKFPSGPRMNPKQMVSGVKQITSDWKYDAVSVGYPGVVRNNKPASEPNNLGGSWVGFDFESAFRRPVKAMNDAAMQALGSYKRGLLLFVGLGTGLGSALVQETVVIPIEMGHLFYLTGTLEDYLGLRGLDRFGKREWGRHVAYVLERLLDTFHPNDVVLGGGNAKKLKRLPAGCRLGDNANAFVGGFRLWEESVGHAVAKFPVKALGNERPKRRAA